MTHDRTVRCGCRWADAKDHDQLLIVPTSLEAAADAVMSVATWDDCQPDARVEPTDYCEFARAHGWIADTEATHAGRIFMALNDLYESPKQRRHRIDFDKMHASATMALSVANDLTKAVEQIDVLLDAKEEAARAVDGAFETEILDFLRGQQPGDATR